MAIKLGSIVRDTLTGFTGMATGRVEYLYGCARIMIEPAELHDSKPVEGQWIDEQRVEVIEGADEEGPLVSEYNSATSGGPESNPIRQDPPGR